jgi:hypothetical protein
VRREQDPVLLAALVAGLLALVISVVGWPLHTYGADPVVVREEARAILLHGQLAVETPTAPFNKPGEYYVQNPRNGGWYSKYGVFGSVASLPPLLAERVFTGELPPRDSETRTAFLNYWNTVLTVCVVVGLVRVASLYTRRVGVMVGFALGSVFATFLWNYARAQSSEIVQVLLGVVMFDQGVRWLRLRARGSNHTGRMPVLRVGWRLGVVWGCAWALVLTRVYFLTLLPAVVLLQVWGAGWQRRLLLGVLPVVGILVVLGVIDTVKFGGPTLTGYHAFEVGRHRLTWDPRQGLWGFLVSAEKGVWWHYPLFGFALLGWWRFSREHRAEAVVLAVGAAMYFVPLCTVPSWAGNWGYGPRYLVFGLPLVSVPVLFLGRSCELGVAGCAGGGGEPSPGGVPPTSPSGGGGRARRGGGGGLWWWVGAVVMGVVLAGSAWLNFQVNRLEFFAAERVRVPLEAGEVAVDAAGWPDDFAPYTGRWYFDHRPWGLVIWDIFRCEGRAERHPLWPTVEGLDEDRREAFRRGVWEIYRQTNWYWETRGRRFDDNARKLPEDWKGRR